MAGIFQKIKAFDEHKFLWVNGISLNFLVFIALLLFLSSCSQHPVRRVRTAGREQNKLLIPVDGIKNFENISPFGVARDNGRRTHEGIDIFAPAGTAIIAPLAGKIVRISWQKNAGNYIYLMNENEKLLFEFLHLHSIARGIFEGKWVGAGTVIGFVGNTGNAVNTPPHLHYAIARLSNPGEYYKGKTYMDPLRFYRR